MINDIETILFSDEDLKSIVERLGKEISNDYKDKNLVLVSVLKGSVVFMADLMRAITVPCVIDFMSVSSYGAATQSSGVVNIKKDLERSIEGENVIIVEDIIDSGNTLSRLMKLFETRNPKTITICTLLDKPDRREVDDVKADYTGFVIPDKFVVGFGLDYDQRFRNLPYIGFVEGEI